MTILKFKDIATVHLTDGDVERLDHSELPLRVMKYEEGWMISTVSLIAEETRP